MLPISLLCIGSTAGERRNRVASPFWLRSAALRDISGPHCTHFKKSNAIIRLPFFFAFLRFLLPLCSPKSAQDCLVCHGYLTLSMTKGGQTVSLHVDEARLKDSIHSSMACVDCHQGFDPGKVRMEKSSNPSSAGPATKSRDSKKASTPWEEIPSSRMRIVPRISRHSIRKRPEVCGWQDQSLEYMRQMP